MKRRFVLLFYIKVPTYFHFTVYKPSLPLQSLRDLADSNKYFPLVREETVLLTLFKVGGDFVALYSIFLASFVQMVKVDSCLFTHV